MTTSELLKRITGKEPILYYTDNIVLQTFERDFQSVLISGNRCLNAYKSITGFEINTYEELLNMINNPEEYYKSQFYLTNQNDFKTLTKLKLDYINLIELPDGFESLKVKISEFKKEMKGRTENYCLTNNEILPSTKVIARRNSKAFLVATTSEEKARLKIALSFILLYEQVEAELESSIKPTQFNAVKKSCNYARPLPHQLKIVPDNMSGGSKLIPNPSYINEGFGGTDHLGFHVQSSIEKLKAELDSKPKLGARWVKFNRQLVGGGEKLYTCLESEYEKLHLPADRLIPGTFNELGEKYGTPINLTKSRAVSETIFNPFINSNRL